MHIGTTAFVMLSMLTVNSALAVRYVLTPAQEGVVSSWLAKHPGYRVATDRDCTCDQALQTIRTDGYGGRWKPVPDYHPYTVVGDFNGDGVDDVAVVVARIKDPKKFTLLVFNGPLKTDESPSFTDADSNMTGVGLFYGPPRPKPYRLVMGGFESEGYVMVPMGQTYRLEPISSENE